MLEELWDNATVERPLHVLARPKEGRHPTKRVRFHQIAVPLPRGAFLEIAPGIALCSPELVFVQMAESLSAGELIAWAMSSAGATLWMQDGRVHLCGRSLQRQGDLLRSRSAPSALRGRRKRAPSFLSFARNQHR